MKKIIVFVLIISCFLSVGCSYDNANNELGQEANKDDEHLILQTWNIIYGYNNLQTYFNTGSKDHNDYSVPPIDAQYPFCPDEFPEPNDIKNGYLPINELFDISDEVLCNENMIIGFANTEYDIKNYQYVYYFEAPKLNLYIEKVTDKSIEKYYLENGNTDYQLYNDYQLHKYIDESFRVVNFEKDNGKIRNVDFIVNGYRVSMFGVWYRDDYIEDEEYVEAYKVFMTDSKYAAFFAFFSDDPDVLSSAVQNLKDKAAAIKEAT